MTRILSLCLLGSILLLIGCTTEPVLPRYPNSRYLNDDQISGTVEMDKATVHHAGFEAWEHIDEVGEFYNRELTGRPGWKGEYKKGMELCFWSDGNIKLDRSMTQAEPKDPSKPGHMVYISKAEGRTFINHIWSVPK